MKIVDPKVFLVGESRIYEDGLSAFLSHIGVPDWISDAPSDVERLIEVYGRLCYRSWEPGLNKNVTRVRKSNEAYIKNIINVKHGSVTEHAMVNFIFADVSRVYTHELVRHRAGTAISQESLRFVRLTDLSAWMPTIIREDEEVMKVFVQTFDQLSELQKTLAAHFKLDEEGIDFRRKKVVTSALRRLAPDGLATNIGWSANIRAIRWAIEMRTAPDAEEEIRLVFGKVAAIVTGRYPHLFADFAVETVDGLPWYRPTHSKV